MKFVPLADDDLPADFRARFGFSPTDDPSLPTLEIVNALSLARKEPPSRDWLIYGLIPAREITMLSGDGGTGKSLLALQLAVARATGTEWAGQVPNSGRTLFVSAEDDIAELHRRLAAIVRAQRVSIDDLESLDILPLAGRDAVLATPRDSILKETALFKALEAKLDELRPDLLILDTLADLFGGDEIKRPHARQFIGMLRGLAIKYGVTILLLSHPSLTGITSGTGTSGSTAWSNSVRSRLYFERPKGSEGDDDDDRRILTTKKANYGRAGGEVVLRWRDGVFVLDGHSVGSFDKFDAEAKAEHVFLGLLAEREGQGRDVSPKPSQSYAPSLFAVHPDAKGVSKKAFAAAMERLLKTKRIAVETTGPMSRRYSRIVLVSEESNS